MIFQWYFELKINRQDSSPVFGPVLQAALLLSGKPYSAEVGGLTGPLGLARGESQVFKLGWMSTRRLLAVFATLARTRMRPSLS